MGEFSTYLPNYATHDRIRTDPNALLVQADKVSGKVTELRALMSEVEQIVRGTASYWNGEAADTQRRSFAGLSPKTEEMYTRVTELSNALKNIALQYIDAEGYSGDTAAPLPGDIIK